MLEQILSGQPAAHILRAFPAVNYRSQPFRLALQAAEARAQLQGPAAFSWSATGQCQLQLPDSSYACGRFEMPQLAELKASLASQAKQFSPQAPKGPANRQISLSVFWGTGPLSDIQYQVAHADGRTLFQLASQFNTLEAPYPGLVSVYDYLGDPTQGPLGVLPTFPGALLRHYAAGLPGQQGGFVQSPERQLNLLTDALPAQLGQVQHGYLMSQQIPDPQALAQHLSAHFEQIRVGYHADLEAYGTGAKVHQVLTSTLAGGSYSQHNTQSGPWLEIQRQLLRAAYLGSLLLALREGHRQLLLTAIGGGVFANPHWLIWESLLWALAEAEKYAVAPLRVMINLRSFDLPQHELEAACQARDGAFYNLN